MSLRDGKVIFILFFIAITPADEENSHENCCHDPQQILGA
jgi:hypothetical protein